MRDDDRAPGVAADSDQSLERNLSEQLDAVLIGGAPPAAKPEDVVHFVAVRTNESAHVFDDTQDRRLHLLEHLQTLHRIRQRDVLRRRYDHGAGDWNLLDERELNVACARGKINDQIIEISPIDV